MVTQEAINDLANRIAEQFKPEEIILFGSHAYGTPRPDSDVDLLVIMPFEGNSIRAAARVLDQADPPFAVDLILRSPETLRWRIANEDFFLREITGKGKVLYETANI